MTNLETRTTYFDTPGKINTDLTLELAYARSCELGLTKVLVATTSGETAALASERMDELNVIAVTHSTGFHEPNVQELIDKYRARIGTAGGQILTCQHALGGVNRAVRKRLNTYQLDEIIAYTLRIWGQGIKVVAEIALMAADAGLVRTDELVMAVAGSGRGADTAAIVRPTNAQTFFDLQMVEIICRPSPHHPGFSIVD